MKITEAQRDMRLAYFGGSPGIFASALVWLFAAIYSLQHSTNATIIAFFIGGMLIHPAGVLLCKLLGRSGQHGKDNPLGRLALELTFLLIFGLPLVYAVSLANIEWFFPAMLLLIGGRYLSFATLYGMRMYWAFGFALAIAAYLLFRWHGTFTQGACAGAAIEMTFAAIAFFIARKEVRSESASAADEQTSAA